MAEELTNPLTSLLKHKYGIKSPSTTLRFTEKDTLITKWRKTAQFIFKNGDWSDQDYKDAIQTSFDFNDEQVDHVGKQGDDYFSWPENDIARIKKAVALDTKGKATPEDLEIYQVDFQTALPQYFVIDTTNHLTAKQGESYHFRNDPSVGSWKIGNANLTIGYAKLHNDVLAEFDKRNDFATDKEKATVRALVGKRLAMLAKPQYAKEFPSWFQTTKFGDWTHEEYLARTEQDPRFDDKNRRVYVQKTPLGQITHSLSEDRWRDARISNQAISFLNDYLNDTYNVVIEQRYERDLDKQTHARAWEQKKQINKETQAMMDQTQLKKYFSSVELDNDVDLELYKQLSPEMMNLLELLPAGDDKPILRLRKLGNYKAQGMYVPSKNTLVVDFRRPGEIYQGMAKDAGSAGYTSFIHEYGHYLDRHLKPGEKPLSLQPEFRKILQAYQRNVDEKFQDTPLAKKKSYFTTPTEVFARAFELYTHQAGLQSNLIGTSKSYHALEYRCFDMATYQEVKAYFDKLPGFETLAKDLNQDITRSQPAAKEPLQAWESTRLYNLDNLMEQAKQRDTLGDYQRLKTVEDHNRQKELAELPSKVLSQKLEQSGIPDPNDQSLKPVVRMVARITRHELTDALTNEKQEPFKFTAEERELLKQTPPEKMKGIYLSSTKSTQTFYNRIAKKPSLAPKQNINKPKGKER